MCWCVGEALDGSHRHRNTRLQSFRRYFEVRERTVAARAGSARERGLSELGPPTHHRGKERQFDNSEAGGTMGDFLNDWLGGINNMFGMDQAPVPRNEYNNNPPRAGTSSNGWSEVPNHRNEYAANYRQASNYVQSYPENRRSGVYQYPPTGSGDYRQDSAGSGTYVYPQNSGSRSSSSYEVGPRYPSVGQVVVERSRDSIPAVLPPRITSNRGIPVQMGTESTPRASVIYHSSPSPGPDAAPWCSLLSLSLSLSPVSLSLPPPLSPLSLPLTLSLHLFLTPPTSSLSPPLSPHL